MSVAMRASRTVSAGLRPLATRRAYATAPRVFITEGKRTPFGKFGGSLINHTPNELATHSAKATLAHAGVDPKEIDHVIFANVVPSTTDTIYGARHVGQSVGAKVETPAYSVNRLCGSGIQAISDARHLIQRGEAHCVLVTGAENMSMIPHLTYGTRFGTRFESFKVVDMLMESLTDKQCGTPMAITAENLGAKYGVTRAAADEYSLESHKRASNAFKNNFLQGEISPIELKKGAVSQDEHIRPDANIGDMNKLKAVFKKDGLVTAATASGIVDGAATVLVVSEEFIQKHKLHGKVTAEVGESTVIGVEPSLMGYGPVPAIEKLLEKTGKSIKDIDLVEINEAFSAQVLACMKALNIPHEKLNIWGGAVAIGHPLGASGIRISNTLARQLQTEKKQFGIAAACIGGGQGIALMLSAV